MVNILGRMDKVLRIPVPDWVLWIDMITVEVGMCGGEKTARIRASRRWSPILAREIEDRQA